MKKVEIGGAENPGNTAKPAEKVQLWAGGPYWADRNIGAEQPWEYGCYFWWGDTVGYKREGNVWVASDESASNFQFQCDFRFNVEPVSRKTYNRNIPTLQCEGWITTDAVLAPEHDAAQVQWGGGWRMPTDQELSDLCDTCEWIWTTMEGVNGCVVRGKGDYAFAGIFIPAAGYGDGSSRSDTGCDGLCWSSVPDSDFESSWCLEFDLIDHSVGNNTSRFLGLPVRPVQDGNGE